MSKDIKLKYLGNPSAEWGRDRVRRAGRQEKAGPGRSWFPGFLMLHVWAIGEFHCMATDSELMLDQGLLD